MLNGLKGGEKNKIKEIWSHSVLAALWTECLVRMRGVAPPEDGFVAGLLHDVGRAVVLTVFPKAQADIDRLTALGRTVKEAEIEALSQTHADIGSYLCNSWKFPTALVQAVGWHHAPPKVLKVQGGALLELTSPLNAACRLASLSFNPDDPEHNIRTLLEVDEDFRHFHHLDSSLMSNVPGVYEQAKKYSAWIS